MEYLADTNVIMRRVLASQPGHEAVDHALTALWAGGDIVYVCPQSLIEFHSVATRPPEANGLGMLVADARQTARDIEAAFPLLPDAPLIYARWCALVEKHNVVGRQVFDARLVAVMQSYGLTHLLTLDTAHFRRFPEITVVLPEDVTAPEMG